MLARELAPDRAAEWDRFVESHPGAGFFHRWGWREAIARGFGHELPYLCALRDGQIEAVLPLTRIRSRLFGHYLVSNAFCVEGGPLARSEEAGAALLIEAKRLAAECGADFLEVRCPLSEEDGWRARSGLYAGFHRDIDPDPEKNLLRVPRKQRAMVRKGLQHGLFSEIDQGIGRFYHLYATSVRNLGTPVFPRRYFQALKDVFGEACEITTVLDARGQPLSSVMSFLFRDQVLPYYGGGTQEARAKAANDFMYWEVMRRAAERGLKWFDFGRSKIGTGAYSFKKNWGFEPVPLTYSYWLGRADEVPEINPLNPKYRRFIAMWQRLPLPLANFLGPFISRNLG